MNKTGTIKLFVSNAWGVGGKVLSNKVYCNTEDRKRVINQWQLEYDKIFHRCFFHICPGTHQSDTHRIWRNIRKKCPLALEDDKLTM